MKPDAGARAEARGEATLCGSLGESTGPENASLYARGVHEAHVGEILDVFGVNGRSRGPVVTVVVSEAAQLGTDLPARESASSPSSRTPEYSPKEECAPEAALTCQNESKKFPISDWRY
jgi:hypothetical protein